VRTSESKGHQQLYDSSAAFEPEVRKRNRRELCANFGFAALAIEASCFARMVGTRDIEEGLSAWQARRAPRFTGT
jgi:hypothetical protein